MTTKKRNRRGQTGGGEGNTDKISRTGSQYTTPLRKKQSPTIEQLISQADSRYNSDPPRAGCHFLIWLSASSIKWGLDWPGEAAR